MRKQFRMTDEQLKELKAACRPVPYLVFGGIAPKSPQENANDAWCSLGNKLGFDYHTVEPCGDDQRDFTAEEKAIITTEPEAEPEGVCGICGEPGPDKIPHPITWPGEKSSTGFVHAECEQEECERAFRALSQQERDSFLNDIIRKG